MDLLLIAHEYPPNPSPQSLRWMYLTRELVMRGHRVDVLTVKSVHNSSGPQVPQGVRVHGCFSGPVRGALARLQRRRPPTLVAAAVSDQVFGTASVPSLNWKGRAVTRFVGLLELLIFPDIRGEWRLAAKRRLLQILSDLQPDVVVSSHEPATTLELGLLAKRAGYPWIIDLGDPVLAPYTPRRWRARAYRLEHEACCGADAVVLTSASAADLMRDRHGVPDHKLHVITQGFDDRLPAIPAAYAESDALELFYSGSLYAFRRIDRLLDAVRSAPRARLTIASSHFPDVLAQAIASSPQQVRYIGFLPHNQVLRHQRQADVLVNLGNDDPCQIPGKVFEYLGAGRPILHVCEHPAHDEAAAVIAQMCVGMAVENTVEAIAAALRVLAADRRAGRSFEVPQVAIERYGWSALSERYSALLQQVAA